MLRKGFCIALLLLCAFSLRCIPYREVFEANRTHFFGTDPYYHMRRIFLTMAHYPDVPDFDFCVNFSTGAPVNWPAGFDLLLATPSLAIEVARKLNSQDLLRTLARLFVWYGLCWKEGLFSLTFASSRDFFQRISFFE